MTNEAILTNAMIVSQWDNNPISILNAIRTWFEDRGLALKKLKEGQENQNVWRLYDNAYANEPEFWDMVFYATSTTADWANLEDSLNWQNWNNWDSLNKSGSAWNAKPKQEAWAYSHLLSGSKKDPATLRNYRACWKENKAQVMALVSKISQK
jgi:hypothetical protein